MYPVRFDAGSFLHRRRDARSCRAIVACRLKGARGSKKGGARSLARPLAMAFTPAATAYGKLDDGYFTGVITQSGQRLEPFTVVSTAFNDGAASRSELSPMLLLNCYCVDEELGRKGAGFDGIWFANQGELDQNNIQYATEPMKNAIELDLAGMPFHFILAIGWWQTVTPDMIEDVQPMTLPGGHTPGALTPRCVGVGIIKKGRITAYHPNVRRWVDIVPLLPASLASRLSPAAAIPFANFFDVHPMVARHWPVVPFEMVVSEEGSLTSGGGDGGLCAFE